MPRDSFRRRQFVVLLGLSLALIGIMLGTVLPVTWSSLTRRVTMQLEAESVHRAAEMEHWLEEAANAALLIASDISRHFGNDGIPPTDGAAESASQPLANMTERLRVFRDVLDDVASVSLLDLAAGRVFASSEPTLVSRVRENEDYFINGQHGLYVSPLSHSVGAEAPEIVVAAPITDLEDVLLGVVVLRLDIDDLVDALGHPLGLEEDGRTYLVDRYGFYATMPPGVEGTPLGKLAESEGITEALTGKTGTGRYVDPRGTSVIGAYRWLPEAQVGLLVEADWSVVTAEIQRAWTPVIISGAVLLVLAVLAARYLANWLVRPLERIGIAARALEGGDLARRAPTGGPDEIGQLADTFNRMADSVQRSYEDLERAVSERTQELEELNRQLEGDIVIRRQAEEALRESEQKYRSLFENMLNGFAYHRMVVDDDGRPVDYEFLDLNDAFEQLTGLKRENVVGRTVKEVLPGIDKDPADWIGVYGRVALQGEEAHFEQFSENLQRWYSVTAYSPQMGYFVALFFDVTERKQAEETLRRSEENLRAYLEGAPDGVYINDLNGVLLYGNREAQRITGYTREELVGGNFLDLGLLPAEYIDKAAGLLALNAEGQPTGPDEFELVRKDGTHIWVEITTMPVEREQDTVVVGFTRDISERRRMEEQLQRSQLLASLGEMTAGIAHEVNNPLAAILLYAELVNRAGLPQQVKKDLRVIRDEARRASAIMKDLLTYSRKAEPVTQPVDVHPILKKVIDMRRYQEQVRNVEIATDFSAGPLRVHGNSSQLTQLFMNLIVNAEEAVEQAEERKITVTTVADGEWARISVTDTGAGIPKKNLSQVFIPFFSTKTQGRGTGLGLSTCYGIATAHRGTIRAENNRGAGSTFIVELPRVQADGDQARTGRRRGRPGAGRRPSPSGGGAS